MKPTKTALLFIRRLVAEGRSLVKRRRLLSCFPVGLALLFLNPFAARAATFNIGDGDVAGLKNAIALANSNNQDDTINLAAGGMYVLSAVDNGTEDALPIIGADSGHTVTINGQGASISCQTNAQTLPNLRIFDLTGNAVISNLTLENAVSADRGAAIQNGSGTLTVSNCIFSNNKVSSTLVVLLGGAGLYNNAGTVNVLGCTFSENMATETNTGANARGGAIFNNGTMTVADCSFYSNTSKGSGGAIHNANTIAVLSSTFESNAVSTATSDGGGGFSNTGASATIQNCTFVNNQAISGGAVYNLGLQFAPNIATLHITSCTFSDNVSTTGYIFCDIEPGGHSLIIIQNSILQGNDASLRVAGGATITSQGYNLCRDGGGGFLNGPGDQINTDALLDPVGLQNNGGSTLTIALTSSSPAIDKGKSFNLTTDQRGRPRPVDQPNYPNASGGDGSDIGAFEGNDSLQTGTTLTVNTLSDQDDGICGGSDCSLREAIHRANGDGFAVHTITFAVGISGTITLAGGELDLNQSNNQTLTLTGPGARVLAISGGSASRVFSLNSGAGTISGLTIRDGMVTGSTGNAAMGGGIYNQVSLTVNDCMFTNNQVKGGGGPLPTVAGGNGQGGAIYNGGQLTLNGCTFSTGNMATGGNGLTSVGRAPPPGGNGGAGQGGAVFNAASRSLTMTNCSFYANTAQGGNGGNGSTGGNGGAGNGGAVGNAGVLVMTACTLESNAGGVSSGGTGSGGNGTAGVASGGITNITGGTATVTDTISANNVANGGGGADVDGAFISGGYNLLGTGDHSTGFTATGDRKGTDAAVLNAGLLGPPSNTGGPTDTLTLTSNSLAIDASSNAVAPHRDQRGYLRTGRADIGAFENNGSLVNLVSVTRSGSDLVVGVEVVKGKVYRLERKINLTDAQWQSIFNNIDLTATGNDIEQLKDVNAIGPFSHAFYHVIFVH